MRTELWRPMVFAVAFGLAVLGGCPLGGNQEPTVNAGADQNVTGGSLVTLTASATDPDGDPLSFQWTQASGPAVTLLGANTDTARFTAPNVSIALTFQVTVDDGNGGTASDAVIVSVTASGGTNIAPVANAGPDQTVHTGQTVTLSGTGTDANNDPLTFLWTQTAGPAVTLTSATSATPTFIAPAPGTLTFQLAVNDGQATGTDSVNVVVAPPPVLYVANFAAPFGVLGFDITNPNALNGNIAPGANLSGAQTLLVQPTDIVVTANGTLLAANFGTPSITSYANAFNLAAINGNVAPVRNVQGGATLLAGPASLAVNTANDLVFVAMAAGNSIQVYSGASTAALNGNLPPTRTITSPGGINAARGINLGANDTLYVANFGANNVTAFQNASNLNGNVAPTRTITSAVFANLFDVFIDRNDTMYVVQAAPSNRIQVFPNASNLNGIANPSVTLVVQGAANLTAIAVDSAGNGYIVDLTASRVYGYNAIATRNGTLPPDRTLAGANTQLASPIRVFLLE
jgi:hypothetical protein